MSQERPDFAAELISEVLTGPERVGVEQRWRVRTNQGQEAVAARLLPELARDAAVRRRYVQDVKRRAALQVTGVAEVVATGAGAQEAEPWRLCLRPQGGTLAEWIERRAPAAVDEVCELGAQLADILNEIHRTGFVVRDLSPATVVLAASGPVLTDVGLARVDLLSTRTAASLLLEASPYASPEQMRKTAIDGRSDVFGLAAIMWQALSATLPYGDGLALLASEPNLPELGTLVRVPAELANLLERCLALNPEARPPTAGEVAAALRGESLGDRHPHVGCQNCGGQLRMGQRICVLCGRQAVQFSHAKEATHDLFLVAMTDSAAHLERLRAALASVCAGEVPELNFLVGDRRLYSKQERAERLTLPSPLVRNLDKATAEALAIRFRSSGLAIAVKPHAAPKTRKRVVVGLLAAVGVGTVLASTVFPIGIVLVVSAIVSAVAGFALLRSRGARREHLKPLIELRAGPAALPASDALVGRLAGLLTETTAPDVRERVGVLALALQRLVDHRAGTAGTAERAEIDMALQPADALTKLIEAAVARLAHLDYELTTLDEGILVRELARAQAQGAAGEQERVLAGLERLRVLEDARAAALQSLLEAGSLLRRAVEVGLEVNDPDAEHDRNVQLALASLES